MPVSVGSTGVTGGMTSSVGPVPEPAGMPSSVGVVPVPSSARSVPSRWRSRRPGRAVVVVVDRDARCRQRCGVPLGGWAGVPTGSHHRRRSGARAGRDGASSVALVPVPSGESAHRWARRPSRRGCCRSRSRCPECRCRQVAGCRSPEGWCPRRWAVVRIGRVLSVPGAVPGSPVPSVGSPPVPAGVPSDRLVSSPTGVSGLTIGGAESAGVPGLSTGTAGLFWSSDPGTCFRPSSRPNRSRAHRQVPDPLPSRRAGSRRSSPLAGPVESRGPGRPAGRRLPGRRPLRIWSLPLCRSAVERAVGVRSGAAGCRRPWTSHRRRCPSWRLGVRAVGMARVGVRVRAVGLGVGRVRGGLGAGVCVVGLVGGRLGAVGPESVESDSAESECELSESDSEELESELSESDSPESEELSEALTEADTAAAARVGAAMAITTSTSPHSAAARTAIRRASGSSRARRVVSMPVTSRGAFQQAGDSIANCLAVSITRGIEMIPMSTGQRRAVAPGRELGDRAAQAHLAAAVPHRA